MAFGFVAAVYQLSGCRHVSRVVGAVTQCVFEAVRIDSRIEIRNIGYGNMRARGSGSFALCASLELVISDRAIIHTSIGIWAKSMREDYVVCDWNSLVF